MKLLNALSPSGARRGFTLAEMMVVFAIIALLVGMVATAAYGVRQRRLRTNTAVLIDRMGTALEKYRDTHGEWPDCIGTVPSGPIPPGTDYVALGDILTDLEGVHASERKDGSGPVVDYWGNPILCVSDGINRPGLDIWSVGRDGEDDRDVDEPADYGDDVVNWTRD